MIALALASAAYGGACCVGSVSAVPTRVGECETFTAGFGVGGEVATGRWDADGRATSSSLTEAAAVADLGLGYRWKRWGYATARLPTRINYRQAGDVTGWGGGVGDATVSGWVQPWSEKVPAYGKIGVPTPVFGVGVRAPTGRAWDRSDAPLMADVTGRTGVSGTANAGVMSTMGTVPWGLMLDLEAPHPRIGATGTLGRTLGRNWTLVSTLRHERALPDASTAVGTSRTTLGGRLLHGKPARWRAWVGASLDLPIAQIGHNNPQLFEGFAGALVAR